MGSNAVFLPNIVIGYSSVIGAGTIVTKNVPEKCVVAGNPARVLGAKGVDINAFTNPIVLYFIIFAVLGTSTYGNREIAYHFCSNDFSVSEYLSMANAINIGSAI